MEGKWQKERKCLACSATVIGRNNKVFCSIKCKNFYHKKLRYKSVKAAIRINEYLKRNHGILLEALGKNRIQKKVYRNALEDKRFSFKYHTHTHISAKGKVTHYVYDLGWMEFSGDEILIVRTQTS
jgi:predicted nucleic acid-binding Zn ribbon protein